jgi:hypothetical protein
MYVHACEYASTISKYMSARMQVDIYYRYMYIYMRASGYLLPVNIYPHACKLIYTDGIHRLASMGADIYRQYTHVAIHADGYYLTISCCRHQCQQLSLLQDADSHADFHSIS